MRISSERCALGTKISPMILAINGQYWRGTCTAEFGTPPNSTSLPPNTACIAEGSFEAGSVELRVTGAIDETEKIDERAQTISLKRQRLTR